MVPRAYQKKLAGYAPDIIKNILDAETLLGIYQFAC